MVIVTSLLALVNSLGELDMLLFAFEFLGLELELLNNLLAVKGPLAELLLDGLVDAYVSFQLLDGLVHRIILRDQLLSLLRLVVQLGGQLVVLQNCESCCRLQLLLVQRHQVCLSLFYFVVHFFAQLLDSVDLCSLTLVYLDHAGFLAGLDFDLEL